MSNKLLLFFKKYTYGVRSSMYADAIGFRVKNDVDPCFNAPSPLYVLVIREHHVSFSSSGTPSAVL